MSEYPTTAAGWSVFLQAANAHLDDARRAHRAWLNNPEQIREAYAPICARLSCELGGDFIVIDGGGNTLAILGQYGPLRVRVTDYGDGDLSHPDAGKGWWVGFDLPDSSWRGSVESIVGDPDARDADGLVKLVAFAVSDYWRGVRHEVSPTPGNYEDGIPRQEYGDA